MVSQKTVLTALLYFSLLVFGSIWLMTRNFPEKKCDCRNCLNTFERTVGFQAKARRHTTRDEENTILSTTASTSTQTSTPMPGLQTESLTKGLISGTTGHKLGVIVPFRDRFEELLEFVPHMSNYLKEKNINHEIYIINQVDVHRFNRASLINAGYLIAVNESCDYIAMHDVDLLPINKDLKYTYPEDGPFHVSAPFLHPKYHYKNFIGGILLMTGEQFRKVNGLSTKFWGWGREDDELFMRIRDANMTVVRPVGITTGYHNTFKHNHDKKRKRDYPKNRKQFKESFKRDLESGLNTMNHEIVKRYKMSIEDCSLTMVAVQFPCNYNATPWCDS